MSRIYGNKTATMKFPEQTLPIRNERVISSNLISGSPLKKDAVDLLEIDAFGLIADGFEQQTQFAQAGHLQAILAETSAKVRSGGSPRWLSAGAAPAAPLKSRFARPGLGQPGLPKGTFAEVSKRRNTPSVER